MTIYRSVWAWWILALVCGEISASPIVFRDEPTYLAQSGPVITNDFELPFAEASSVSFPGFTALENSTSPAITSRTDYVSGGLRALGYTWNGNGYFELSFDQPVTAFGATILDFGTCCGALELWVDEIDRGWRETAAFGANLPRGNAQFFGVVDTVPFQHLRFTSNNVSDNDLIVLDNLSFHAVPEPATLMTAIVGLGMLAWRRRR